MRYCTRPRRINTWSALSWPLLMAFSLHQSAYAASDHLQSQLVAKTQAATVGQRLELGLLLEHETHWHTYWKNSGDSGLPTRIEFTLPADIQQDVSIEPIQWPTPIRIDAQGLINYGYEGRVLLPIALKLSPQFKASSISLQAKARWLICKEVCIPGEARYSLQLPVQQTPSAVNPQWVNDFKWAEDRQPRPAPSSTKARYIIHDKTLTLAIQTPPNMALSTWQVFPEDSHLVAHAKAPIWTTTPSGWTSSFTLNEFFSKAPAVTHFVLKTDSTESLRLEATWDEKGSVLPSQAPLSTATTTESSAPPALSSTVSTQEPPLLITAIVFAFLGGMVLNLMPCVFPILSLKALGILKHANQRHELRAHSLFYTLGVLLSFTSIAALLFALRQGGEQLGWGFQLQEPRFVAFLAWLMCAMALNFTGLFEISGRFMGIGQSLTTGSKRGKESHSSAFFTGVLACLVASPCTAPFMGTALGFAITQPIMVGLSIFVALGLGMSSPLLLLGFIPRLATYLPRPGAWMNTFRHFMVFPLLLTVIWLIWVYGEQTSSLGMAFLLCCCLLMSFGCWILQHLPTHRLAHILFKILGIGGILFSLAMPVAYAPMLATQKEIAAPPSADSTPFHSEAWSQRTLDKWRHAGRPVFVNMTAAWCITCIANQRASLSSLEFATLMTDKNVVYLKGDWTRQDPEITRYLASFGRNGVPLYVLYPAKGGEPHVLPQLLTPAIIKEALEQLKP